MFERRFRLNYVLWIQDLLDSTGNLENDEFEPTREVVGLDVYAVPTSRSSTRAC